MKLDPRKKDSVVDLTRGLIEEAKKHVEDEHRSARPMGTLSRIVLPLAILSLLTAGVVTIYGMWRLPADIPIRQQGDFYVGKTGSPRKREDFEAYQTWSTAMLAAYPTTIALWFLFAAVRRRD